MTKQKKVELILQIADICEQLDWVIGIATNEDSGKVPGLLIGTHDFVLDIMGHYSPEDYEIYSQSKTTSEIIEHNSPELKNKKKNIIH